MKLCASSRRSLCLLRTPQGILRDCAASTEELFMSRRDFVYCPYCATPLTDLRLGTHLRSVCPACHYIHFPDPKVAVIGRIEQDGSVLLVRRGVNPAKGLWALPGGYMDAGELPVAALIRELHEELAIDVMVHELLAIYPMVNTQAASQGIVLTYRVTPLDPAVTPSAHDDVTEARWFGAKELPADLAFESTREQLQQWLAVLASRQK
jgi:8-oxo-dGTP diphosphatase